MSCPHAADDHAAWRIVEADRFTTSPRMPQSRSTRCVDERLGRRHLPRRSFFRHRHLLLLDFTRNSELRPTNWVGPRSTRLCTLRQLDDET